MDTMGISQVFTGIALISCGFSVVALMLLFARPVLQRLRSTF
jgi:hypothetical protein